MDRSLSFFVHQQYGCQGTPLDPSKQDLTFWADPGPLGHWGMWPVGQVTFAHPLSLCHLGFQTPNGLPRTPIIRIWHLCMGAYITIPWGAGASRGGPEGRFCESLIKVNVVDIFNRGLNLGPRVQRSRSEKKWGPWLGDLMWSLLWLNLLVNLVQLRRSSWLSDNDKTIKMFHQIRVTNF